jgi:hypothetical protein
VARGNIESTPKNHDRRTGPEAGFCNIRLGLEAAAAAPFEPGSRDCDLFAIIGGGPHAIPGEPGPASRSFK